MTTVTVGNGSTLHWRGLPGAGRLHDPDAGRSTPSSATFGRRMLARDRVTIPGTSQWKTNLKQGGRTEEVCICHALLP